MKIVHLIYSLGVGGAETMLTDIANLQASRGHEVIVVIVNDEVLPDMEAKFRSDVRLVKLGRRRGSAPLLMAVRLNLLLLRLGPDAIHAHHHKFGRLVRVYRKRLVLTVHDIDTPMVYCSTTPMVAISEAVRADVLRRVPGATVTTIYNGIRTADIPARGAHPAGAKFRIVQLARLNHEKKGQDVLIHALGILRRRGIGNIEATFIGGGPDLELLRSIAVKEGVTEQVVFAGIQDRDTVYRELCRYDAMVHPSRWEGFGLIIAEAMSAGLPLVLTENDGPWEVADNGRLCLSARNGDAESFADAIERLISDYPAALARAAEALEYVKRFDIAKTVDHYINLYTSAK